MHILNYYFSELGVLVCSELLVYNKSKVFNIYIASDLHLHESPRAILVTSLSGPGRLRIASYIYLLFQAYRTGAP